MTTRTSTSAPLPTFVPTLANLLAACAIVAVITSAPLAQAEPAAVPTATKTAAQPTKPEKKSKGAPVRATAGKAKTTSRSAKPAKPAKRSATPAAVAEATDKSAAAAKPSQVMDFDNDDVAGTRLQPGFELIEGAPAKARHGSLVEPLKPSDSVVHRE
jgi:hypothetical protein